MRTKAVKQPKRPCNVLGDLHAWGPGPEPQNLECAQCGMVVDRFTRPKLRSAPNR